MQNLNIIRSFLKPLRNLRLWIVRPPYNYDPVELNFEDGHSRS